MRTPALLAALLLASCAAMLPTDPPPGTCSEVTDFAYVGAATLRGLGFDDQGLGEDVNRPGTFWITRDPIEVLDSDAIEAAEQAAIARARAEGHAVPPVPPAAARDRPRQRLLCVTWADGDPRGLAEMAVPDDWVLPAP